MAGLAAMEAGDPLDSALREFLLGRPAAFLALVHGMHTREERRTTALKSNMGQLSGKLAVMLAVNRIRERVLAPAAESGSARETRERLAGYVNRTLDRALRLAVEEPGELNPALRTVNSSNPRFGNIGEKPFSCLTPGEVEAMREVVRLLVRKLKDQTARRLGARRRGGIDVRKTLRLASRSQGVPLGIVRRSRPLRRGRIVALCDVSGSVWSAARFMLTMLFSLQECFDRVASFIFVSDLCEVTDLFRRHGIDEAIDKALSLPDINFHDHTDYGAALQAFRHRHMAALSPRTTVIVMGDGRSNHHNPQGHILGEIREHCRRIVWLNPEPPSAWATGDSEIPTYRAWCHEVRTCRTLNDLVSFIEELVV
jgi:uncharacterized protein with von Willebrand factor type A (vWA) domain